MLNLDEFDIDRKGRNHVMEELNKGILEAQGDLTKAMDAIREVLEK